MKLSFDAVSFSYGKSGRSVLTDVSFEIPPGSFVALVGPNGSGKSTLARLAAGLLAPSAGSVRLDGREASSLPPRERARGVALLPQGPDVPFPIRALDLVLTGRYPHLGPWHTERADDFDIARHALARVGASALEGREIHTLSGGERQRIFLARTLAQTPRLLVADEPTIHLDLKATIELVETLERLHVEDGVSILLVTHDLDLAAGAAGRVLVLERGGLAADAPPESSLAPPLVERVFGVHADRVSDSSGRKRIVISGNRPTPRPDP